MSARKIYIRETDAELMDKLPEHHKLALQATGDYESMAQSLSVPVGTVKSRRHRAFRALLAMRDQG